MTTTIKNQVTKVTSNLIGSAIGGVAVFYGAKKYAKVHNVWGLTALTLVGVLAGAWGQSKIKAAKSQPTSTTVK